MAKARRKARRTARRKISLRGDVRRLKKDLRAAQSHGAHALRTVRHNVAVAALQWVVSHRGRVDAFRKSVRGTSVQKAVDGALRRIRREAARPISRRRRKTRGGARRARR